MRGREEGEKERAIHFQVVLLSHSCEYSSVSVISCQKWLEVDLSNHCS